MDTIPVIHVLGRPLRLALIGGGPGSFIGATHRTAARLDGSDQLVAGVVSSDPERARVAGRGHRREAHRRQSRSACALVPNERDGATGVRFVEAAVASSRADGAWMRATLSLQEVQDA